MTAYCDCSQEYDKNSFQGRDAYFKPGSLIHDKSKVFVSRFDSMVELSDMWSRGMATPFICPTL